MYTSYSTHWSLPLLITMWCKLDAAFVLFCITAGFKSVSWVDQILQHENENTEVVKHLLFLVLLYYSVIIMNRIYPNSSDEQDNCTLWEMTELWDIVTSSKWNSTIVVSTHKQHDFWSHCHLLMLSAFAYIYISTVLHVPLSTVDYRVLNNNLLASFD